MIYSRTRKFIFIHIPKAAGTTVAHTLLPLLHPRQDQIFAKRTPETARMLKLQRQTEGLRKHIVGPQLVNVLGEEELKRLFTFTFVRNPYARAYSCWRFVQRQLDSVEEGKKRDRYLEVAQASFDEIAADLPRWARTFGAFRPQWKWTGDPFVLDFIGKAENINQDLGQVYARITGKELDAEPNRTENVSTRPSEWHGMSRRAADAIADFYARDFELFDYDTKFEPAASRETV